MNDNMKDKIYNILKELPNENSWIDYKLYPCKQNEKADLLKDVCAFLNSIESYGKEKFIIYGVKIENRYIKGLIECVMEDDSNYQTLFDCIEPKPHIETGTICYNDEGKEKNIGYVCISADNTDRVYSIIKNYPDHISKEDILSHGMEVAWASTAFIRRGSKKFPLTEYERRKMYEIEQGKLKKIENQNVFFEKTLLENTLIRDLLLLGSWNENKQDDLNIISDFLGVPYDEIKLRLKNIYNSNNNILEYNNGIWKIKDRKILLEEYSNKYFPDDINKLVNCALVALKEIRPKLNMQNDIRNFYNQKDKYSSELKGAIAETILLIKVLKNSFINCRETIDYSINSFLNDWFRNCTWKNIASIEYELPVLAEAAPNEILKGLEDIKQNELECLFKEEEIGIVSTKYTYGIYASLELLAWNPIYLSRVILLLCKFARFDGEAINKIVKILLPWMPQTNADLNKMKSIVKMLFKENDDIAWKVLCRLFPNVETVSSPSYKPKFMEFTERENVTNLEYWLIEKDYIKIALEHLDTKPERYCDVIKILDDIPKDIFESLIEDLSDNANKLKNDEKRFIVWNSIQDLLVRHNKYIGAKWILPDEALEKIKKLSEYYKPKDEIITFKRWFREDSWNLMEDRDYQTEEKKLLEKRKDIVRTIIKHNRMNIFEFCKIVENGYELGLCVAEVGLEKNDEEVVLNNLKSRNKRLLNMAKAYCKGMFNIHGFDWMENINFKEMTELQKVNLFISLPKEGEIWALVKKYLNNKERKYWEKVDIRFVGNEDDINYALEQLINVRRYGIALDIMAMAIHNKTEYDRQFAIKALNGFVKISKDEFAVDRYDIQKVISDLQQKNLNEKSMLDIEWKYAIVLDEEENRAITIEKRLAKDPKYFCQLLSMIYKPASVTKEEYEFFDERIVQNAYRILNSWKWVPGSDEKGEIKDKELRKWYEEMVDICKNIDRTDVGLECFGKVLFYSKSDSDGLWINRSVASILNEDNADVIRRGFNVEAFNSVGVVTIDKEGSVWYSLAKKYFERAEAVDNEGYCKFATSLRDLARRFEKMGENEKYRRED